MRIHKKRKTAAPASPGFWSYKTEQLGQIAQKTSWTGLESIGRQEEKKNENCQAADVLWLVNKNAYPKPGAMLGYDFDAVVTALQSRRPERGQTG